MGVEGLHSRDAALPKEPEGKEEASSASSKIVGLFKLITKLDERIESLENNKLELEQRIKSSKGKAQDEIQLLDTVKKIYPSPKKIKSAISKN